MWNKQMALKKGYGSQYQRVTEDIQVEILGALGSVFAIPREDARDWWERVWEFLKTHHPDMLRDPTTDYADSSDIGVLRAIWDWQNIHYKGET